MNVNAAEGLAFVVLFRGNSAAEVHDILHAALNPAGVVPAVVRVPQARGLDFLAAEGPLAAGLDAWWGRSIPARSLPLYLTLDEPGLEDWIPGTHGAWFVGVEDEARAARLEDLGEPVFAVRSADPELVSEQAMQSLSKQPGRVPVFHPGFPYRQPLVTWARPLPQVPPSPAGNGDVLPETAEASARPAPRIAPTPTRPPQPISYDQEPRAPRPSRAVKQPPLEPQHPAARAWGRLRGAANAASGPIRSRLAQGSAAPTTARGLGVTLNANRPIVAAFASRKGGVGKTTHAAGVAATVGESLDGLADTAALVDGNITNPDSWALNPPPESATVRMLVSSLSAGQVPPAEQYARTPRLAIYPESRDSEEVYTQAEVDVVAEYLKRRHAFIAVDLPNSLPSLDSGGGGAVAAAWLAHCDVVVLPFNADPRARQGLLEYVDAVRDDPVLESLPILAPYILSSNTAIATDPAVQADLGELRRRGVLVVEVPDDENALLALLRDLPINRASPRLRRAYARLTEGIVDAAIAARQRG